MKFKPDKVSISRADVWYHQRVKRNYSFQDNLAMILLFAHSAKQLGVDAHFVESMTRSNLRCDRMMYESKRKFARHLDSKADFYNNPEWLWIHQVSAEDTRNYINPLFDNLSKVDSFVAKIYASGASHVSDSKVDELFLENFGSVSGFVEFEMNHMDNYSLLLHAKANGQVIDRKRYEDANNNLMAFKAPLQFVAERVFQDLTGGGK